MGRLKVSNQTITIKAIDNTNNLPIANIELFLQPISRNKKLSIKTNDYGIADFEVNISNKFQLYSVSLQEQNNYKTMPICDRLLINYNAINEIQELRFDKHTDIFKINIHSKVERYCFQKGDLITFKAYCPDYIKDNDIKWAYTFISKNRTLQKSNINKTLAQGNEEELKQYPANCLNNGKYYPLKDKNNQIYLGREVKDYEISNVVNDSKMIIFAYTKKPLCNVYAEIVLNDIIQISIDCSMQEALNAIDEVSQIGWTTSYVLQRLWHDNPKNATTISQLNYKDSKSLCKSIENRQMQKLIYKYAPNIELKLFEIGQTTGTDSYNFYVELDWEEFYLKFPMIQEKYKTLLNTNPVQYTISYYNEEEIHNLNLNLSDKFKKDIADLLFYQKRLCRNNPKNACFEERGIIEPKKVLKDYIQLEHTLDEAELDLIVHTDNIKNGKSKTELVFSVYPKNKFLSIQDKYKRIGTLRPCDIDKTAMQQGIGISDMDFGKKLISFDEQTKAQALALYACTGKFSIYYIPAKFLLKQENGKIYAYVKEIYAYIYDVFDFDDEGHNYGDKEHKDDNIIQLGKPVGTWDYKAMRFDFWKSISQMRAYKIPFSKKYISWHFYLCYMFGAKNLGQDIGVDTEKINKLKQKQIYPLYNQDYQNYKKTFNKGLNFKIFSKDKTNDKIHKGFYIVKVPNDKITQEYFRLEL